MGWINNQLVGGHCFTIYPLGNQAGVRKWNQSHANEVTMTLVDRHALPDYYLPNDGRVYSGVCWVGAIKGKYALEKCSKIKIGLNQQPTLHANIVLLFTPSTSVRKPNQCGEWKPYRDEVTTKHYWTAMQCTGVPSFSYELAEFFWRFPNEFEMLRTRYRLKIGKVGN